MWDLGSDVENKEASDDEEDEGYDSDQAYTIYLADAADEDLNDEDY